MVPVPFTDAAFPSLRLGFALEVTEQLLLCCYLQAVFYLLVWLQIGPKKKKRIGMYIYNTGVILPKS